HVLLFYLRFFARDGALFLLGSCLPRDLHSFPTRRSSDLRPAARHSGFGADDQPRGRGAVAGGGERDLRDHVGDQSVRPLRSVGGDRKSTRLNSSHGSISYAVFCLKKKIKGCVDVHLKWRL